MEKIFLPLLVLCMILLSFTPSANAKSSGSLMRATRGFVKDDAKVLSAHEYEIKNCVIGKSRFVCEVSFQDAFLNGQNWSEIQYWTHTWHPRNSSKVRVCSSAFAGCRSY